MKAPPFINRIKLAGSLLTPRGWSNFREAEGNSRNRSFYNVQAVDAHKTDTAWTRTALLSHARRLRANVGFVGGVVRDLQLYTLGPSGLIPKSLSADNDWAMAADDYFEQWCNVCDVTARFNFRQIQRLSIALLAVDGDFGLILTETPTGFPRIQLVEAHQISSQLPGSVGPSEDEGWIDGVKTNRLGQPIRYRVISGDSYSDIAAEAFVHVFEPERATAQRGISHFAPVINHLRDIEDIVAYAKLGVKKDNSIPFWMETTSGGAQLNAWDVALNASNIATSVTLEQMIAGEVPRLKLGEKINAFNSNKPAPETMALIDYLESDTLASVGLPTNWKNLHKEGGATLRAALIRAQYRFLELQALLKDKELSRVRNWVVAKAAKRGDLPKLPVDWWKHVWRGPAHLTADVAKISRENREDMKFGIRTFQEDAAESGDDWKEIRDENETAASDILERATRLSDRWKIPMLIALQLLQQRGTTVGYSTPDPGSLADPQHLPNRTHSNDGGAHTAYV